MEESAKSGNGDAAKAAYQKAKETLSKCSDQLRDHLAHEERQVPVELEKTWNEKKLAKLINDEILPEDLQILKKLHGGRTMTQTLPLQFAVILACMEVWGGKEYTATFWSTLPPPVKLLMSCQMPKSGKKLWADKIKLMTA